MRRLAWLTLLALATQVEAQTPTRGRWSSGTNIDLPPESGLRVDITFPTESSTWETTASTLEVRGSASKGGGGCQISEVTWVNDRGGSGQANGTCDWVIPATEGVGSLIRFLDDFNVSSNITLEANQPSAGTDWAKVVSQGSNNLRIGQANDYVWPNADDTSNTAITVYQANSALAGQDYDVSVIVAAQLTTQMSAMAGMVFGYVDTANYCGAGWVGSNASTDLVIVKRVAGVRTVIASADANIGQGNTVTVQARDADISVLKNGVLALSVTDSACGNDNGVGLFWGSLDVDTRVIKQSLGLDSFQVAEQAAVAGITLQSGANVITVTACDIETIPNCTATDVLTVTKAASDTIAPIITPDVLTFTTTSAGPHTFSGGAEDAIGATSITGVYDGGAPITGVLTGTAPDQRWDVTVPALTAGTRNLVIDGTDAAANDSTARTIVITYNVSDVTDPSCTITSPSNLSTHTSSPITVTATCSDAGSGVVGTRWTNSLGGSSPCSGTTSVTCSVSLVESAGNLIDVLATDGTGNESNIGAAQISVTLNIPIQVASPTALPAATDGIAYTCFQMTTSGHFGAVTWTNNGAGTTLNDSDPNCAGFTMTTGGLVCHPLTSYDRTGANPDICNWVSKPTDAMADTTTKAHTIQINDSVGVGRDAFFNNINATLPVCTANNKGTPCVSAAVHLSNQATINAATNAPLLGPDPVNNDYITYNASNGFAEIRMPQFSMKPNGTATITNRVWGFGGTQGPWPAASAGQQSCVQVKNDQISDTSDWAFVVGDYPNGTYEIVKRITNASCPQIKGTDGAPSQMNVIRGVGGTTPQAWPLETVLTIATKKLGTINQMEFSIGASNVNCGADLDCTLPDTDGIVYPDDGCGVGCSTYLIMWDFMWDATSRFGPGGGSVGFQWPPPKTYNIQVLGPVANFVLPQLAGRVCKRADNVTTIPGCDLTVQVTARNNLRHSANGTSGGFADWSTSNGKQYCSKSDCVPPHMGSDHGITPQDADQLVYPNVIYRAYVFIEAKFDDYDKTSYWIASQTTGVSTSQIHDELKLSLSPDEGCRASGCTPHSAPNRLSVFEVEYDISAYGEITARDLVNNTTLAPGADGLLDPMVSWFNNFQVIRGLTKAAAISTYIDCGVSCKPVP